MNEKLISIMKEYGLDEKEIQVYLFLVKNNRLTAYKIAKETKIHKSTTYYVLERLIEKNFINKENISGIDYYSTNDISSVKSELKNKEQILDSLIPEIRSMQKNEDLKVRIMEGDSGAKQFNFDLVSLIKEKRIQEVYMIGNGPPETLEFNIFIEKIIKEIRKDKTYHLGTFKGIWNSKYRKNKFIDQYKIFGENRFLDNIPSDTTTIIFGDYVTFSFLTNKHQVIEIKNKSIANELKAYFNHLWEISKK